MIWNCVYQLDQALVTVGGWGSRPSTVEGGEVGLSRMCKLEAWDYCGLGVGTKYVGLG